MSFHRSLIGAALLAGVFTIPAWADGTFKFAFQGTLKSLDPHSFNETFTLGTLGNVY